MIAFPGPVLGASAALLLVAILAGAALHKLRDWTAFRETVRDYRLLPDSLVSIGAMFVVGGEILAVLALLLPATRPAGAGLAAVLLVFYGAAIGINLARGRTEIDCGCSWGGGGEGINGWLLVRNAALLPFAWAAGARWELGSFGFAEATVSIATALTLFVFYHAADRLITNWSGLRQLRHAH